MASLKGGPSSVADKKINKSGRLPQAPASLLVQLPPDELKKFQNASTSGTNGELFDAEPGNVEASDLHLLATSIQQRREREARVFQWQQRLIDADERLSRSDLKRALTQLSLSSWLQVLQERHLNNRCTYPTCSRKPMKPHISLRETVLPLDAPRYRISLSKRTIKRDERDDAGGENGYCTKACWRRGEWVSRWVLEGNMANRQENEKQTVKSDQEFGSAINSGDEGLGTQVDEGGRWERLVDEDNWQKVELLEDLEDDGQVERLSDDESVPKRPREVHREAPPSMLLQEAKSNSLETAQKTNASETLIKDDLEGFSTMLDSLEIVERPIGQTAVRKPIAAETSQETPLKESHRFQKARKGKRAIQGQEEEEAHISDADSDDLDVLGELSLRSGAENGDDVVSTILRSSRTLQRVDDAEQEGEATEPLTEEELARYKEEDDLFAQAWQARDEEIAKGSWQD